MTAGRRRLLWGAGAGLAALLLFTPLAILTAVDHGSADGLVMRALSSKLHRPVRFTHMHTRLMTADPTIVLEDVVVGSPPQITPDDLLHVGRLTVHLRLGDLLVGRFAPTSMAVDVVELRLVRLGPGRNNYTLGKEGGTGGLLATVKSLSITRGRMWMNDPDRQTVLAGEIAHDGRAGSPLPLVLDAKGAIRGGAVTLLLKGGPLNGRKADAVWPLQATIVDGDARMSVEGSSQKPFDFRAFDLLTRASGPNLADVGYLIGTDTPNSAPFALAARVRRSNHTVRITEISGRLGGSDITGAVTSDHSGPQRMMTASLRAGTLQAADVAAILAPAPPHAVTRLAAGKGPLISRNPKATAPLPLKGMRKLDGAMDLSARRVLGSLAPLYDLSLRARLQGGRLAVTPIAFGLAPGRVAASLTLDAIPDVPRWTLNARLAGARLGAMKPAAARTADGDLDAWADLHGLGSSLGAASASTMGRAAFRISQGRIQKAPAAILGGDLFQAVSLALGDKSAATSLDCAVGEFAADHGVMTAQRLAIVTGAGAARGSGSIDLGRGQIDLAFKGTPTGRRLLRIDAPVTVTGPLAKAKVGLDKGRVLRQAGVATALAVVATPLAAVLPFLGKPGQAPDCGTLLAEAGRYVDGPRKP